MKRARGTGTIEKRIRGGRVVYYPRMPDKERTPLDGFYETEEAAAAELDAALKMVAAGDVVDARILADFGDEVLDRRELAGFRNAKDDRRTWKRTVKPWECSSWPLGHVSRRHVREWLRGLKAQGLADQSRANALNLLRAVFYEAEEDELIDDNPCADLRVKKSDVVTEEEPSTFLTLDELAALFWSADQEGKILITFAAFTGMREGEIFAAPPHLFSLKDDDPHVLVRFGRPGKQTKTKHSRRKVPLLGPALEAARAWQSFWQVRNSNRWVADPVKYFFPTRTGRPRQVGHPFGKTNARWDSWLAAAGITRNVRFHDLRHTCATLLLSGSLGRKWTLEEVRKMLGHSSVVTTERYARLLDNVATDAAREMRGSGASGIAAISCEPTSSQLPTDPALSARFLSRLRDLNSRPTVYERQATLSGDAEIARGVGLAVAVVKATDALRLPRSVLERALDVLDAFDAQTTKAPTAEAVGV